MSLPQRILVTGGGTGIGYAIAEALVQRGATVFICGRRRKVLERAAAQIGATPIPGDITGNPEPLIQACGPLDGLVHNAGHWVQENLGQWTAGTWQDLFEVHVQGPALLSQAFAAQAKGPGAIVAVGSTLGERPVAGSAAYAAAKAGLLSLVRSLAVELAPRGIRANAVLAGVVPTAMTTQDRGGLSARESLKALEALHPLGLGQPEQVAQAVIAMLENEWISGAALAVDGGLLVS
jgi:NAD(P)-dependent dehydrogenase (short-subunit alcohol dehydrogenase family)